MVALPTVPKDTNVNTLFAELMPKIIKEQLANSKAPTELAGTEITNVIDISGDLYSYTLKNGANVEFKKGDLSPAKLRVKIAKEDMEKMIKSGNLDMITGMTNGLNKSKYNAINTLKGSFMNELTMDDGGVLKIQVICNGATTPSSTFKMSFKDASTLMRRETNPVNLFMSGAMKIEGDMSFAMGTQPLFS